MTPLEQKTLPRRVRGLSTTQVVTEDGPHPPVKAGANGATPYLVDLASRATSVPFTTVTTGHERTATDNNYGRLDLRPSPAPQVAILADLALGAGGRLPEAVIGLAVHR